MTYTEIILAILLLLWWFLWTMRRPRTRSEQYRRLLRDPRWKARKDAYYSRNDYQCAKCDRDYSLQLHHRYYIHGRLPWEYPDSAFQPLCWEHHMRQHGLL